jgi:hypothetical protein
MRLPARRVRALATIVSLVTALGVVACDKGPMEKAGEKIDSAVEKAGEKVEKAADSVKK